MASPAAGRPVAATSLVEPSELAALLAGDRPPVVLDVRWQLAGPSLHPEYLAGHLPGARWADLDADFADPPGAGRGRHPLPSPARLGEALRRWGVADDSVVVVYDQGDALAASRAWWVLRWSGLAEVRVLDGGLPAWIAAGEALAAGPEPTPPAGTAKVRPGALPVLDADAAAELARAGVLLDARTPERFRGDEEPIDPVAGHIPGARNAPSADDLCGDGRFRPAAELAKRYAALGARAGDSQVGAYCGSGVTAARTVLALHLAGVTAALYPGSWSEWVSDPSRPVAIGDEEGAR